MLSALYYLFLVLLCTFFMILSALALVLCYPFDKGRPDLWTRPAAAGSDSLFYKCCNRTMIVC